MADEDILHALEFPIRHYALDDHEVLVIGPDRHGGLLEVVLVDPEGDARVIHAMPLRRRFVRFLEGKDKP
ncbi:hypothetical protein [Microcella sp.]|uniref:hypothetical protein n=1 Tax=Microcella sp. TaxID=1913979 RepID=UPI00391A89E4